VGRLWRLTRLTPSTQTRIFSGLTSRTRPVLPRYLPLRTFTVSPLRILMTLHNLRSQRDDLHKLLFAEFARDGSEDTGAARFFLIVDNDGRVFGEAHGRAVFAAGGFPRPHDDGAADFRFFHGTARNGILDRADDNVADAGVAAFGAAEDTEAHHAFGARVVGHVQPRVFL